LSGKSNLRKEVAYNCLNDPPDQNPALHRLLNQLDGGVARNCGILSELVGSSRHRFRPNVDGQAIDQVQINSGDMKHVALAAVDRTLGQAQSEPSAVMAIWLAGRMALAYDSAIVPSIIVHKSGHFVRPALVADPFSKLAKR
jgi:hypothetical protein